MDDWDKLDELNDMDEYYAFLCATNDPDSEPTNTNLDLSGCSGCLPVGCFLFLLLWLVSKLFV